MRRPGSAVFMWALRLLAAVTVALLAAPTTAVAQRDRFLAELVGFLRTLSGIYGDEGPRLTAHLDAMGAALDVWDASIRDTEFQLRPKLKGADAVTALQVHTLLASLYLERSRFDDAARAFNEDIRIDPRRAAFHRLAGLAYQAASRHADAAAAFRNAWLRDPEDPQNAYRLLAFKTSQTSAKDLERALATLSKIEIELTRRARPRAESPFLNVNAIDDDAGGTMAFVPARYAPAFSVLLRGDFAAGITALRAALATDPLVADPASRSDAVIGGIAALREGRADAAIELLEGAVAKSGNSSEAHRILGTAYSVGGNVAQSVGHLRDALRLNRRDERSWLALARTLEDAGQLTDAVEALRQAVTELPDSGALRWRLSATAGKRQRTEESDLVLVTAVDRLVMLAGRGELYGRAASLAQAHLDYERAVSLLERRVALTPNNAAAHKVLGRAYVEQGREEIGYAELVVALLLDPDDPETLTTLGRLHLAAGRLMQAIESLERAIAADPGNAQAVRALGDALLRSDRTAEGQQRVEESVRLQAGAVEEQRRLRTAAMLSTQAELGMAKGDYSGAIATWQQAIELEPRDTASHLRLADAFVAAKRPDEAVAQLKTAISMNARPEAHRRLAEVYAALGRAEESASERRTYVEKRLRELATPTVP